MGWVIAFLLLFTAPAFAKSPPAPAAFESLSDCHCYFIPPESWDLADPTTLSQAVKIAFLTKGSKGFCPSINLAIEKTHVSINEYLKAVKAIHEQDRSNQWRALGKVKTQSGLAQLTEIDSPSEYGPIRLLQLILLKDGYAYVLTAAALKEEFSAHYQAFQTAFRSLTLTTDLFNNIPQLERRETLKLKQAQLIEAAKDPEFQEEHWLPFQKAVLDGFKDMGTFWQILVLRDSLDKLKQHTQENVVNSDSATQTEIEAQNLTESDTELGNLVQENIAEDHNITMTDDEDRFGPDSQNLAESDRTQDNIVNSDSETQSEDSLNSQSLSENARQNSNLKIE